MVTNSCPWCTQEELIDLAHFQEAEVSVTCAECGTTVEFIDEPDAALDLAA